MAASWIRGSNRAKPEGSQGTGRLEVGAEWPLRAACPLGLRPPAPGHPASPGPHTQQGRVWDPSALGLSNGHSQRLQAEHGSLSQAGHMPLTTALPQVNRPTPEAPNAGTQERLAARARDASLGSHGRRGGQPLTTTSSKCPTLPGGLKRKHSGMLGTGEAAAPTKLWPLVIPSPCHQHCQTLLLGPPLPHWAATWPVPKFGNSASSHSGRHFYPVLWVCMVTSPRL